MDGPTSSLPQAFAPRVRTPAGRRRPGRGARRAVSMRSRGSAAAVWALWAVACGLLGLALSLACWLTAALLRQPLPLGTPLLWLLGSALAFAVVAPRVRAQLRDPIGRDVEGQ